MPKEKEHDLKELEKLIGNIQHSLLTHACMHANTARGYIAQFRDEIQKRKQNPQIPSGHIDCWKQGYLDAIDEFSGEKHQ